MKQRVRKLSIRFKILIPAIIIIVVMCVSLGLSAYYNLQSGMVEMGVEEAELAAAMALRSISGDDVAGIRPGSEETQRYLRVLSGLRKIQRNSSIAFLYTLYTDGEGNLYYGVDTDDSESQHMPGDKFDGDYSDYEIVFNGENYSEDYIEKTDDGNLISSYLPIYDNNEQVVGILGCDYEATNVLERISKARTTIILIGIGLLAIAAILMNIIVGAIMKSMRKVDRKIYDLVNSEGDLTKKLDINSGDELELIADNVNSLLEHIRGIMLNISANSGQLNTSAGAVVDSLAVAKGGISGVSETMEEMSAAMQETSASLYQVNESVNEIDRTVIQIANKASQENKSSNDTVAKVRLLYNKAENDKLEVGKQAKEMSAVVNDKIERSKAVKQIDALTDEIINITEQTSLLALNANIEAARAGDVGKGFAVVAAEIGALAANSAKAAEGIQKVSKEVIEAVNELAKEAENMIAFMNDTAMAGYDMLLENSRNYQNDVSNLSKTMEIFAEESEELRNNISSIKEAVDAVNIAVEESTKGVVNVTEISVDLTGRMQDINDEASSNREIAGHLGEEVGKFKIE